MRLNVHLAARFFVVSFQLLIGSIVYGAEAQPLQEGSEITITTPDDWHYHFRDDNDGRLQVTLDYVSRNFRRAIAMPNLVPAVTNTAMALEYEKRILSHLPAGRNFTPLMTLYLTDNTTEEDILEANASKKVVACKLYPAGATTNSHSGVTDINKIIPALQAMAKTSMLLLVHGETTNPDIDIFDRENDFIEKILKPLLPKVPGLKIVLEHITTKEAVDFVLAEQSGNIAATITAHHLLYNRNALFKGGLQPHMYCLPILKSEINRKALLQAIQSGSSKFFLGTDSAAHYQTEKEKTCGCAGVFTAVSALELYAEAFEEAGALEHFENFASVNGPRFYGLEPNKDKITLVKKSWTVPKQIDVDGKVLIPLRAGESVKWQVKQ